MEVKDDNSADAPRDVTSAQTHAQKNPNKAEAPPTAQPAGSKKRDGEPTGILKTLVELQQFLNETVVEFRKISWPTRTQVIKETWSVLVLVTALTLAVLAFDFAIARVVFEPLDKYAKKTGGGVGGSQTQTWGPLQAEPGAPVDQPGVPGNALPVPQTLPPNSNGPSGQPSPAPTGAPAPTNPPAPSGGTPTTTPAQPQSGN